MTEAPALVVLGTDADGAEAWVSGGQALERMLLAAAEHGLQASYLNQPCQVAELLPRLLQAIGRGGHAHVVLRLGYPKKEPTPAPRRPLGAVIDDG